VNYLIDYYNQIENSQVIVSKRVEKVYKRLVGEINNPKGDWIFDESKANKPIEFIERFCKHSKGEWIGKSIKLELFQKAFISALFGFVNKDTGFRRYKETFFFCGRKNGKSVLLSSILLFCLIADGEGGAECYSVASKKDQAKITFNESLNMVRQSPYLSKHLKKRKTDLYFPLTFSKFEALASDSNTLDGLNSHCVVIDELHSIKDRNLYEVMKQSMSARQQPLLVMITTAGTIRECIFDDMYDYAVKISDGLIIDDRFLPILYELDSREEWTDWKCWQKANPGLGTIKKLDDITEKVERAKVNPKDLTGILCKDLNIRENNNYAWLTFDTINNEETFTMDDIKDSYCFGGIDLSSTSDLTCATLLVMKPNGKKYVLQHYWIPDEYLEKKIKEDQIPYGKWRDRGFLSTCLGSKVNYQDVSDWFLKMFREYGLRPIKIGFDPWNAQYFTENMRTIGFDMQEVRQGARSMSSPAKELAADLNAKEINYNNNPVLKWNLSNTCIYTDPNGNIRPVKSKNQRQRIDGCVSLIITYCVFLENLADYKTLI
jgi:phage terminase large subunit-like protein